MALNRYRLADKADKKNRKAILLQKMIQEPDRLLGTILLGNNLVNNAAVAITTILAWKFYGEAGVAISTAFITVVILVLAEIPPKTVAAVYPEKIAYFAAYLLNILQRTLYPIVWLVSSVVKLLELIPGFKKASSTDSLKVDELRFALMASKPHIKKDQMDLLLGILELGAQTVDSAMVPRTEIHAIDLEDDIGDIIEQLSNETYSRLPVYEKSFEDIKGILEIRELFQKYRFEEITKQSIVDSLKEPIYIPEDSRLLDQIQRLQLEGRRMAVVVDEYGELTGLVSHHEMLEEVAGIVSGQLPGKMLGILEESDDTYIIDATINIRDLNRTLEWDIPTDGPNTLNGLILEKLEDIPEAGKKLHLNGFHIETVRVRGTAVDVVRIRKEPGARPT